MSTVPNFAPIYPRISFECDGLNVYMRHIDGYPGSYDRRAGKEITRLAPNRTAFSAC
jgi:hypothetical protein